jgi:glycosyltransferase involved in cell wall biosynthesis
MTLVIPSRHGGRSLYRLLAELEVQLLGDPSIGRGFDVVVALDGCDQRALSAPTTLAGSVPVTVVKQSHHGLAAARNLGLKCAQGDLVWFLDDDEVPVAGALRARRTLHEQRTGIVVMGPNFLVRAGPGDTHLREWFEARHARLARSIGVTRFDDFSAANTSGPVDTFRSVGGFDERFVGWGYEDLELGHRFIDRSVPIVFEPTAGAFHGDEPRTVGDVARRYTEGGRNLVLLLDLHSDARAALGLRESRARSVIRAVWSLSPRAARGLVRGVRRTLIFAARVEWSTSGNRSDRLMQPLTQVCLLSGMIDCCRDRNAV